MADFLLYGIDEAGRAAFSEVLRGAERAWVEGLAQERLEQWHAVEVWEGPMCVVRLRRADDASRQGSIRRLDR